VIWAIIGIDAILQTIRNYCRHIKPNILNSEFYFQKTRKKRKTELINLLSVRVRHNNVLHKLPASRAIVTRSALRAAHFTLTIENFNLFNYVLYF